MRRLLRGSVALLLTVGVAAAVAQTCRKTLSNVVNTGQCITVSTTAVDVLTANSSRCSALILNNSVNGMNCRDLADGAPTATAGTPVLAGGGTLALGLESQGRWQCIRSGGADAIACVTEGRP